MVNQSIEVIPGILEKDTNIIRQRIADVKPFVKWVQIDIADGKLVPNTTLFTPDQLKPLLAASPLKFELHMMVQEPFNIIDQWIETGFRRFLIHIEGLTKTPNSKFQIPNRRQSGIPQRRDKFQILHSKYKSELELGLALDAETQVEDVIEYLDAVDCILVMTVKAGFSGQKFMPEMLEKVRTLRMLKPHLAIEVDGGINEQTARQAIRAGANRLVTTSYIFHSPSIEKAIWTLKNLSH